MTLLKLRYLVPIALVLVAAGAFLATRSHSEASTTVEALARETHFHGIAVDSSDPGRLYLATHHGLYAVAPDGAATRLSPVQDFMGFTPHPTDPSILYASGHPAGGGNLGFIASEDGGRSWSQLAEGVGGPVDFHQMDVSPADPTTIYGAYAGNLQISRDGGQTWEVVAPVPEGLIDFAASSKDSGTLYAATQSGLLKSEDGGKSWQDAYWLRQPATMVHVTPDGAVYAFVVGTGLIETLEPKLNWQTVSKAVSVATTRCTLPSIRRATGSSTPSPSIRRASSRLCWRAMMPARPGHRSPSRPTERRQDAYRKHRGWSQRRQTGRMSMGGRLAMAYVCRVAAAGSWRAPKQSGGSTMARGRTLHRAIGSTTGGFAVALALSWAGIAAAADDDYVIQLTQTGCQFLESERGVDRGFEPRAADDCNRINAETGDQRLASAEILELSPGTYTFRVTNTDVPYELGFWLREADYQLGNPLHKLTKVSISGGGLYQGQTKDYTVELEPGVYLYSCPLNPTPNYRLVVKG